MSGQKCQEKLKNFFIRKKGSRFKVFAHKSSIIPEVRKTDSYLSVRNNTTLYILNRRLKGIFSLIDTIHNVGIMIIQDS
jgi:hypothetical protein